MSKIHEITPIKKNMHPSEVKHATEEFLRNILTSEKMINVNNCHVEDKVAGVRPYKLVTLEDGTSWVQGAQGIERIIGAHYLETQLKELGIDNWSAVETKYLVPDKENITVTYKQCSNLGNIPLIEVENIITFSRYVGDIKPVSTLLCDNVEDDLLLVENQRIIQKEIEFTDMAFNANLRKQEDGTIIIIDTEYGSFSNSQKLLSKFDFEQIKDFKFSLSEDEIMLGNLTLHEVNDIESHQLSTEEENTNESLLQLAGDNIDSE